MKILYLTNEKADKKDKITNLFELYGESYIEYHNNISLDFVNFCLASFSAFQGRLRFGIIDFALK